jgi:hypothetical protein
MRPLTNAVVSGGYNLDQGDIAAVLTCTGAALSSMAAAGTTFGIGGMTLAVSRWRCGVRA